MTRVLWLTDVHLNFVPRRRTDELLREVAAAQADWTLIGGDIAEAKDVVYYTSLMISRLPGRVALVLGNHDFYYGSIASVRRAVADLCADAPHATYLTAADEPIEIAPGVGLIGHDGWADARVGDYERSDIMLNDYGLIAELAGMTKVARREVLERLGDEAAGHVARLLARSLARFDETVLLTHVPPLREACWHEGRLSDDDWSPHFTCLAVGNAILEAMRGRPDRKLTVLCGHTHGAGETRPLPNVHIITGGAEYGRPAIQREFVF